MAASNEIKILHSEVLNLLHSSLDSTDLQAWGGLATLCERLAVSV
jgi:hypothetical protein